MALPLDAIRCDRIELDLDGDAFEVGVICVPGLHKAALKLEENSAEKTAALGAAIVETTRPLSLHGVMLWDDMLNPDVVVRIGDDEDRAAEAGIAAQEFVQLMMPTYDALARRGITTIMHAELGPAAWMFRAAAAELCRELVAEDPQERQRTRWILRRLISFVGLPRRSASDRVLTRQLRSSLPWRPEALELFAAQERPAQTISLRS